MSSSLSSSMSIQVSITTIEDTHVFLLLLAVLGFRVFAACLTSQGAEKLQAESSSRVTTLVLDISDEKSISAARDFVAARLPEGQGLWGVVNNAAIVGPVCPSEWLSRDGYQTCLAVNLLGLIDVTRTFLPLVRRARGRVVNTASMSGRIAVGPSPYCMSKYGVEAFSDCLRREVYRQGVQMITRASAMASRKLHLVVDAYVLALTSRFPPTRQLVGSDNKNMVTSACWLLSSPATLVYLSPAARQLLSSGGTERTAGIPSFASWRRVDITFNSSSIMITRASAIISPKLHLVVDAYVLALTSRFPPTRQLVGSDVRLFYRLLWNLPTPLTDWILNCCFVAGLFPAVVLIYQLVTWLRSRIRVGDYHKKHVLVTGCDTGFGNLLAKRLDGVYAIC
ncbi:hypothetical protein C0Q70_09836 [Pomacea canaliculata]|uniref:Uncharacterized protein n=1 Tax=Pomacea canaliculata TaxID=400727 RepID=A0A2T7PAX9_POMCA|nr:hypothetical protein C0Q70_09836 [Pomacea canaliculata]